MKLLTTSVALCIGLISASSADAALVPTLGGQVVNDTDLNVTWLANANLAASNTFGVGGIQVNGQMAWDTAQSWIAAMNAADYLGYNNWRLPTTLQPDVSCSYQSAGGSYGYFCTGSEMGHLFYNELGGVVGQSITTIHNTNYGLFQNIQPYYYWSGTEYAPGTYSAWNFDFNYGDQGANNKFDYFYALAVRSGQVAAVPVPAATWLLGSGLLGLVGVARCKCKLA